MSQPDEALQVSEEQGPDLAATAEYFLQVLIERGGLKDLKFPPVVASAITKAYSDQKADDTASFRLVNPSPIDVISHVSGFRHNEDVSKGQLLIRQNVMVAIGEHLPELVEGIDREKFIKAFQLLPEEEAVKIFEKAFDKHPVDLGGQVVKRFLKSPADLVAAGVPAALASALVAYSTVNSAAEGLAAISSFIAFLFIVFRFSLKCDSLRAEVVRAQTSVPDKINRFNQILREAMPEHPDIEVIQNLLKVRREIEAAMVEDDKDKILRQLEDLQYGVDAHQQVAELVRRTEEEVNGLTRRRTGAVSRRKTSV